MARATTQSFALTKNTRDQQIQEQLLRSIARKKGILKVLTMKVESLTVELELISHEYNVRIGSLLLQDNELDLEIIRQKNIQKSMEQGLTYNEAVLNEENAWYSEIIRMQKEQESINEEKEILSHREQVSDETQIEIKKLWKKLVISYHPDLVTDPEKKKEREIIIKKVNAAYRDNNLEALRLLESNAHTDDIPVFTIEALEKKLVAIENTILMQKVLLKNLQNSQWFFWKKRQEKVKNGKDIFRELEQSLLNDILAKIQILKELKGKNNKEVAY